MTEKELKKLNRRQLLELLLKQTRKVTELQEELDRVKAELENRARMEDRAGSLAEAALKLNDVVEAAQAALNGVSFFEKNPSVNKAEEKTEAKPEYAPSTKAPSPLSSTEMLSNEQRENNSRMAESIISNIESIINDLR